MKYYLLETAGPPITLEETKTYLNITHAHHDDLITRLINAALVYCEEFTGNAYRKKSYRLEASIVEMAIGIVFAKNPVSELKEISVIIDGSSVALHDEQYVYETSESRSYIVIIDLQVLRNANKNFNAVKIMFDVDYDPLPQSVIQSMLGLVAFLYENRGDTASLTKKALPSEILTVLEQDRVLFI